MAVLASGTASASPTACPGHFPSGQAPDIINPKLADQAEALCYEGFAVLHSSLTRTPLWSAEHLTGARVAAARRLPRAGVFHAETALPPDEAADLTDYRRSGCDCDCGHLSPNGDMSTPIGQRSGYVNFSASPE